MKNKRGGKRPNAGRPNNNSVRRNITIPIELDKFVKKNNLSLSKLAQQKIKEIMEIKVQNISGGNQLFQGKKKGDINISHSDIATIEALHDLVLDKLKLDINHPTLKKSRELTKKMYSSLE